LFGNYHLFQAFCKALGRLRVTLFNVIERLSADTGARIYTDRRTSRPRALFKRFNISAGDNRPGGDPPPPCAESSEPGRAGDPDL
jgi:hypothetical protein